MRARIIGLILVLLTFISCANNKELERFRSQNVELEKNIQQMESDLKMAEKNESKLTFLINQMKGVKARIITNYGNIELEFFPELAPIHCYSFILRAESGFYENTLFHRVMPNFMLQGGDPNTKNNDPYDDGIGAPLIAMPHEFNSTKHVPGILSTARVPNKAAGAGSQFFIMHGTTPHLDEDYTVFGKVTKGMDVVNKIATVETEKQNPRLKDRPVKDVRIQKMEVYR
jgi:peptidyl-prolyl cis-trans isomerase B (cyclophilin B)